MQFSKHIPVVFAILIPPPPLIPITSCLNIYVYRFSVDSLKNKHHHTRDGVDSDSELTEKQKQYLLDIHDRSSNCVPNPSPKDISRLERAYSE